MVRCTLRELRKTLSLWGRESVARGGICGREALQAAEMLSIVTDALLEQSILLHQQVEFVLFHFDQFLCSLKSLLRFISFFFERSARFGQSLDLWICWWLRIP